MKRDEALRALSREHHQVLALALKLRRAADPAQGRERFLPFWDSDAAAHFRLGEEVLLPTWAAVGAVDQALATRMLLDHLWIRAAASRLRQLEPGLEELTGLGVLLAAHVRLQEREVFSAIEAALDAVALVELGAALKAAGLGGAR